MLIARIAYPWFLDAPGVTEAFSRSCCRYRRGLHVGSPTEVRCTAVDAGVLSAWVTDARRRTLEGYADLDEATLRVPYAPTINPPVWELGHVAWFQEYWVLRRALGQTPLRTDGDALWNSAIVGHAQRWELPLPSLSSTCDDLAIVRDRVLDALDRTTVAAELRYYTMLSVFHEDMHGEAFAYTRQAMGWPAPPIAGAGAASPAAADAGPCEGDVEVPAGPWRIGAEPIPPPTFVFDNEKWAHTVDLPVFRIARAPVTQAEYAAFVDDGGYRTRALWTEAGWSWRAQARADHPLYWRRAPSGWERRFFERWIPVSDQPHRPIIHVCAHEAEAWCRWAARRLPSEAEWERASVGAPIAIDANLDLRLGDTGDVGGFAPGDSAVGCRQMIGNVWEWTASAFGPYPGFERDPYAEYSHPWFGDHRVLRGGCFVTRARLLRPTWRNFYQPHRRDVWAGFRTCALD
jgi:iron(II)-dependent oxidoreductase